ncbi:MAG: hypothetical protein ACXWKA_02625 [Xanthobacteraceae bacterium]
MHDQVLKSTMIAAVLLAAGAAEAQDTRCGGGYRTMAGQQTQAWLDTRAGKPCHMTYVTAIRAAPAEFRLSARRRMAASRRAAPAFATRRARAFTAPII